MQSNVKLLFLSCQFIIESSMLVWENHFIDMLIELTMVPLKDRYLPSSAEVISVVLKETLLLFL